MESTEEKRKEKKTANINQNDPFEFHGACKKWFVDWNQSEGGHGC